MLPAVSPPKGFPGKQAIDPMLEESLVRHWPEYTTPVD